MKDSYSSINFEQFISMLNRSAASTGLFTCQEDSDLFTGKVIDFCNCSHDYPFSNDDFDMMCSYLSSSVKKLIHQVTDDNYCLIEDSNVRSLNKISDISSVICGLCDFSRYLALYWKNKYTRNCFCSILTYMLEYPLNAHLSNESLTLLLQFYIDSNLLETICFCINTITSYSVDETLLSSFMKLCRRTPYNNLFIFHLFQFNNRFYRHYYKIYPDECSVLELYYGLTSGFFSSLGCFDEALELLRENCIYLSDSFASGKDLSLSSKSLSNPLFAIWNLYNNSVISSIREYACYFELLFL